MTEALSIYATSIQAATQSRSLIGDVVKYGVPGRTSAGMLRVRPGALRFPEDLARVKLTKEHNRDHSRGYLASVIASDSGLSAICKVAEGPEGDDALREAKDKTRDGFSFDVLDALIEGDELVDAEVIAIGQVGIPAYADSRITQVAASTHTGENEMTETPPEAPESPPAETPSEVPAEETPEEEATPETTAQPEGRRQSVAASVPGGVPSPSGPARTAPRGGQLSRFIELVTAAVQPQGRTATVTAALSDITNTAFVDDVSVESWSGELWSGLQYTPQFVDLFTTGPLTNWKGKGWRWVTKPEIEDYAGDKAEIPSNAVDVEPTSYTASRLAGGWDIDRKFYDFPDAGFIASFLAAVRESYAKKRDLKVRDYMVANAVIPTGLEVTPQTSLLKAARLVSKHVKRNTDGSPASFIYVNDDDLDTLFEITEGDVSAFLALLGVRPEDFRSSADIVAGFVYGGAKQSATVRELPGASPLRVEAQHLTHGGIDNAFFGYIAIEEHHTSGIVKVPFDSTP